MPRVTISLRTDVRFEDGEWMAADPAQAPAVASLAALCARPARLFTRPARALDAEHVALADGARHAGGEPPPDLNVFYVVDGDPAAIAAHELVATVVAGEALRPAAGASRDAELDVADRSAHARDARGQGVRIAIFADGTAVADAVRAIAPEAEIELVAPTALTDALADALDRTAAELAFGDVIVVPYEVTAPALRAAIDVASSRGVVVVVPAAEPPGGASLARRAGRVACAQSYAAGVGAGRVPPAELLRILADADWNVGKVLDVVDSRHARVPRPMRNPRAEVVFDAAKIIRGGDLIGDAEIYFEGWVDDGLGHKVKFRIPHAGHIPDVKDGQNIPVFTTIFEGKQPLADFLHVHIEAWDEDLGRQSLLNPDDLLGVHDRRWPRSEKWGEGLHSGIELRTDQGAWILAYTIHLKMD